MGQVPQPVPLRHRVRSEDALKSGGSRLGLVGLRGRLMSDAVATFAMHPSQSLPSDKSLGLGINQTCVLL